ncbi:Histidine kinase [bacterium A37T11]|nr:Histidine kinase [bacterium A37T11]
MILGRKQLHIKWIWISIGAMMLFIGISSWIYQKLDQRLQLINNSILLSYNREKAEGVQHEFDQLFQQFEKTAHLIKANLLSNDRSLKEARISSTLSDSLTIVQTSSRQALCLINDTIIRIKNNMYLRKALPIDTTAGKIRMLISYTDLDQLNQHFWKINEHSRAYFSVLDQHGRYLIHPDQRLIGKLAKKIPPSDTVLVSEYLELPVRQTSRPLYTGTGTWILAVAVPDFTFEEDAASIRNYMVGLGVVATCLLLLLVFLNNRSTRKAHRLELAQSASEKEHAILMLERIRQKFDPHFLFNSLGSLTQLIQKEPMLAVEFVNKLARVYRYVLQGEGQQLATLADELEFAKQYFFLLKIRFGKSITPLQIQIDERQFSKKIPVFSLQILIENAIKHNEISLQNPLQIKISTFDNQLWVINNWQPRKTPQAPSGYGMQYLRSIYEHFGIASFAAKKQAETFQCILPLL